MSSFPSGRQQFVDYILELDLVFDTCIVDEAAQATEPATLIPLRYGCRTLVLVGDPRQLPATVLSQAAKDARLDRSLFERLEEAGHAKVMLLTQNRMHPEIRAFPSERFYGGLLQDAEAIAHEVAAAATGGDGHGLVTCRFLPRYRLHPVTFLDLQATVERVGTSFKNPTEARCALSLLAAMRDDLAGNGNGNGSSHGARPLSVAVIAAYKPQARLLRQMLREEYARGAQDLRCLNVEVGTVDGFQGREMDVVIFCTVRGLGRGHSHGNDSIGFLRDQRRLNVAITRARKCLVIIGDRRVLQQDEDWAALVKSIDRRKFSRNA